MCQQVNSIERKEDTKVLGRQTKTFTGQGHGNPCKKGVINQLNGRTIIRLSLR